MSAPVVVLPPQALLQAPTVAVDPSASASSRVAELPGEDARNTTKNAANVDASSSSKPVKTTRRCCETSCTNALALGWKWRRCQTCRAAARTRTVTVSCARCSSAAYVTISSINAGEISYCTMCSQGELAARAGIALPSAPSIPIMGPPQARPSRTRIRRIAPLTVSVQQVPQKARTILEEVAPFIHPDHLRIILARGDAPPDLHTGLPIRPPCYMPPEHSAADCAPHYGPRGEILAALPAALLDSSARIAAKLSIPRSSRTPRESMALSRPNNIQGPSAIQRTPSGTAEAGPSEPLRPLLPSPTLEIIQDAVPRKKRKRNLAAIPADPPRARVCASISCGRRLPPHTPGEFCTDCGFLLWRKQFRARVAGLGASVSSEAPKEEKGKEKEQAIKQEHESAPSQVVGWTSADDGASVAAESSSSQAPFIHAPAPPHQPVQGEQSESKPRRLTLKLPARAVAGIATTPGVMHDTPNTSVVVSNPYMGDDEQPLSAVAMRKRSPASLAERTPSPRLVPVAPSASAASSTGTQASSTDPPVLAFAVAASSTTPTSAVLVNQTPSPPLKDSIPVESRDEVKPPIPPRPRIRLILRPPRPPASVESEEEDRLPEESSSAHSSRPSSPELTTLDDLQRQASMLWDSDESELTPLEDLTDMGESEVAESASDDEIPPVTPKDTDVMPHVPWPLSAVRKPQPKHRGICGVGRCMNLLVQNSRLRFCCICATRKRMIQRHHRQAGTVKLDQVDESMVYTVPPGGDLTGLRTCGRRQCKRLIPSEADYRWRTCPSCRVEARNRTRIRRAVPVNFPEDDDSDDEEDIPLAEVVSARRRAQHAIQTDELLPIVPTYQHFAVLLTTLRARFREFAIAQAHYLRFKAQQRDAHVDASGPHRSPHVFRFDGEYSVVADPSGGLVDAVVACVLRNVQAAVGLRFTPIGVKDGPESSVIAILRCMYGLQIPLLCKSASPASSVGAARKEGSEAPVDDSVSDTLVVKMVGELQVWVAWDRRHRFFPGQRIMVRFRLVG